MNDLKHFYAQFENEWREILPSYEAMLAPKTLAVVKGLAWNTYLRGRVDEQVKQLLVNKTASMMYRPRRKTVPSVPELAREREGIGTKGAGQ